MEFPVNEILCAPHWNRVQKKTSLLSIDFTLFLKQVLSE